MNHNAPLRRSIRLAGAVAVTLALSLAPTIATAQHRVNDGRRLDRNLQRGSGEVNPPKLRNSRGIYSNAVVTGNVTGLSGFRDRVGAPAPSEFRGQLGSDDLFDFNRRSYRPLGGFDRTLGGLPSRGALRPDRGERGDFNRGQILLRSGTGASLGNVTGAYQPHGPDADVRRNDRGALQQYRRQQQRQNRERLRIDAAASYSRHVLGVGQDASGRRLRIETSPLRGLVTANERTEPGEGQPLGEAASEDRGSGDGADAPDPPQPRFQRPVAGGEDDPEPLTAAEQRREAMRATTAQYLEPRRLGLTERLGRELSASRRIEPIRPDLPSVDRAVDRALTMNAPTETADEARPDDGADEQADGEAPSDPYERLLWQIRQRYAPPSAEERGDADAEAGEERGEGESGDDEAGDGASEEGERAVDRALGKLDYDLPPVRSLAGGTEKRIKETMSRAERHMGESHYLDAAKIYEQALVLRAGYPPARVGRAHAYLGAGLFASAARVLRETLHDHPELIAARYEAPLLPDEKRREALRRKLHRRAQAFEQDAAAPLLLAYLAYQRDDEQALNKHLSHLNQRDGGDNLTSLLRRIWGDAGSPVKNEPQP